MAVVLDWDEDTENSIRIFDAETEETWASLIGEETDEVTDQMRQRAQIICTTVNAASYERP